jgi:metal-responsive CopG/Arc/MetJ family transcriptional regulator
MKRFIRVTINLTAEHQAKLDAQHKLTGASVSEIIRRAIDQYLAEKK